MTEDLEQSSAKEAKPGIAIIAPFQGVKLHLETDRVAVWEEHFSPKEITEAHRHTRDYLCVALTDIDLTVEPIPGQFAEQLTVLVGADEMLIEGNRGRLPKGVIFHSRVSSEGAAHTAFNNADVTAKLLIIELKGTGLESR